MVYSVLGLVLTANFETVENAVSGYERGVDEELDETTCNAVQRYDGTDSANIETETPVEVKRHVGVISRMLLSWVVQVDGDILVICN